MGKKTRRVGYELDSQGIKELPMSEIKVILRATDELVMSGGRSMLAKILAGSRDKKLLELELNDSPAYGALKGITQKDILAKIDWMILNDYLEIEYNNRLPVLCFTKKGWEIERETYATELLEKLIEAAKNEEFEFVETLKDRNRGMIFLLLDKIARLQNKKFIMILSAWKSIEYKKVATKIQEVMDQLENLQEGTQDKKNTDVISFSANKKWLSIPKETRSMLEKNVFCTNCCDAVQIINYDVKEIKAGLVLQGKCSICSGDIARVID